ncbi:MAG: DUF4178 domain-containing protein [Conchiformibius sp.]|nr:DUF4178 domain-containing protein [Conchiformibius sp.]
MSDQALFHTDCPACGAPVAVRSATAVTVVCGYCNSMLVRQDGSLHDSGRDSALLKDFSPLQIGTTGRFAARGFMLVGRLQVRYDAGVWNEWYARFDDGSSGWLSEAGDLYVFTREVAAPPDAPEFERIRAGETLLKYSKLFIASDVRHITLDKAAAQGELPFRLPENGENRVADWRSENVFLTLDYAQYPPTAFLGKTVHLLELDLQNTRNVEDIRRSAGSLKGTRRNESCPNCGSPVHWQAGLTHTVICPSCGSDLDTSSGKAELMAANTMREAQQQAMTLPLGKTGKIDGQHYTVIGAVRMEELAADDALAVLEGYPNSGVYPRGWWFEYLLYHPQQGFKWLVETPEDGWFLSETQHSFPHLNPNGEPQGRRLLYAYGGRVSYAAGAFYWHIRAGDVTYYRDYAAGSGKLCAERSAHELAWSLSLPVAFADVAQWFKLSPEEGRRYTATIQPDPPSRTLMWTMIGSYCLINLPAWIMMDEDSLFISLFISMFIIGFLWRGDEDDD